MLICLLLEAVDVQGSQITAIVIYATLYPVSIKSQKGTGLVRTSMMKSLLLEVTTVLLDAGHERPVDGEPEVDVAVGPVVVVEPPFGAT